MVTNFNALCSHFCCYSQLRSAHVIEYYCYCYGLSYFFAELLIYTSVFMFLFLNLSVIHDMKTSGDGRE